jgi:hypothetical protein
LFLISLIKEKMIRRRDEEEQDKQEGASWIMGAFSYLCKGNETRKKRMRLDLVQKNMKRFAWIVSPVHIDIRVHI